ncbi:uncharacterized protein LOC141824220 [Curcuma longa]|uniref:uncharacterized protein LOC141824220 n=1 Tax=Curcuma longa TaxID=136217 RepID=UPI003D9F20D5
MYAEAGLQLPAFSQCFLEEVAGGGFHVGIADGGLDLGIMAQIPTVAEYDMGGEGDLFKAPEAILEEPALELDIAVAMSIISTEGDAIREPIKVVDIESFHNDHLNSVIYECKKDLLEESEIEDSITELLGAKIPAIQIDDRLGDKSTSTGNTVAVCSSFQRLLTITDLKTEQRQQKLSRYREKKSKRNFGRKIKYVCRKALADSQPRVRGRFAKTEEGETKHADAIDVLDIAALTKKVINL